MGFPKWWIRSPTVKDEISTTKHEMFSGSKSDLSLGQEDLWGLLYSGIYPNKDTFFGRMQMRRWQGAFFVNQSNSCGSISLGPWRTERPHFLQKSRQPESPNGPNGEGWQVGGEWNQFRLHQFPPFHHEMRTLSRWISNRPLPRGGDILVADSETVLVGVSQRTNEKLGGIFWTWQIHSDQSMQGIHSGKLT